MPSSRVAPLSGGCQINSRWSRLARASSWDAAWHVAIAIFLVLAAFAFLLTTPRTDFPDAIYHRPAFGSALWNWIDFTGNTHPQPWATTLLYAVLGGDPVRLVVQAVVSAAAWLFLGAEIRRSTGRVVGTLLGVAVFVLALTPAVVTWNSLILSESFTLSLATAGLAAAIRLVRVPTGPNLGLFLLLGTSYAFTRANTLPVVAFVAVAAVVWMLADARNRRVAAGAALGLLIVGAWAAWRVTNANTAYLEYDPAGVYQPTTQQEGLFYVNLTYRVLPDPGFRQWLEDRGMPDCPAFPEVPPEDTSFAHNREVHEALLQCDAFRSWAVDWGFGAYLRYMVTHPLQSLELASRDLPSVMSPVSYTPTASPIPSTVVSLVVADLEPSWVRFRDRATLTPFRWNWYEPLLLWTALAVITGDVVPGWMA